MGSHSPPYASGLCIVVPRATACDDGSASYDAAAVSLALLDLDPEVRRKREEVRRWLGGTALAGTPDRPLSYAGTSPGDELVAESAPEDASVPRSSSDDSREEEPEPAVPFTPSSAWTHQPPGIAVGKEIKLAAVTAAAAPPPALEPPFDYDNAAAAAQRISIERSAFDSDTEDEEDARLGEIRISKFSRLRKALRNSMSVPNIAARRSLIDGTTETPLVGTSPESVSALRARQTTGSTTSLPRNPYVLKLATDAAALSPVPSSAANSPGSQVDGDAPRSPSTPATPASPKARETRSFIFEMSKTSLLLEAPPPPPPLPPLPNVSRCHGPPPNLPLPPTPLFASTPSLPLARPALGDSSGNGNSFAPRWREDVDAHDRLTVVDPDMSMARLQETMAKLEAYAPRAGATDADVSPSPGNPAKPLPQPVATGSKRRAGGKQPTEPGVVGGGVRGVIVLAVEPSPTPVRRPPSTERRGSSSRRPPAVPPKPEKNVPTGSNGLARRPSVPMLPLFDFERPGEHHGLDLQGLPLRSTSLQSVHTAGSSSSGAEGVVQASAVAEETFTPQRRQQQPATPPARAPAEQSHFSPESPQQQQQQAWRARGWRMRRLLGVRTELIRGLRGSFVS
ncbi:uncharacterized protein PHACADRAFT_258286 [Phanerochaete carnosa HHB-10118-sp]|uniref:Uncharacterized protein n=1 Tax=Phanerochaete carnosa (strain HHB-10118-sp) TaxID=650164 RepID=K5W5M5_PHACS|nr:uncharacterized protein PHACADRAFT_258286 [Phanerochaete carnosa HHB-10118-sp]EKM54440.1 hypothetical protein PHACADRAFT_258286 [Phanerochaete carnosa HHB-10118-sp]